MENQDIRQDQQVSVIIEQTPTLVKKAEELTIRDEGTSKLANDIQIALSDNIKKLEERKKYYIGPAEETVKRFKNAFAERIEPLKEAKEIIRRKLRDWLILLEERQRKEEEKKRAKEEKKKNLSRDFLGDEAPAPETPKKEDRPTVQSGLGKSYTQKFWTFEVEDAEKIPRKIGDVEILVLDKVAVNSLIREHTKVINGVSSCDLKITGLRIFQDYRIGSRKQ